jgi:molecular chaperone GrpE
MNEKEQKSQEEILSQEASQEVPVETVTKTPEETGQYKDKYVRLLAEFDNMRKRHERDRSDLIKYAPKKGQTLIWSKVLRWFITI